MFHPTLIQTQIAFEPHHAMSLTCVFSARHRGARRILLPPLLRHQAHGGDSPHHATHHHAGRVPLALARPPQQTLRRALLRELRVLRAPGGGRPRSSACYPKLERAGGRDAQTTATREKAGRVEVVEFLQKEEKAQVQVMSIM